MLSSARRIFSASAFCLFAYGNTNWKDQLTAANGVAITYDRIGSPLNDAAWTCTRPPGPQPGGLFHSLTLRNVGRIMRMA